MKALFATLATVSLTAVVIGNAYYQKKQFYPSVVYLTNSNPSMAVMYLQAFILVLLLGKIMRKIFFGQLRPAEFEHLMERSWYAITETCLAFTVFRDDFNPKFIALFTVLLFLKAFHWLAEDRVDYMERSPVIGLLFHIRILSLLMLLAHLDSYFIMHAYNVTVTKGYSVQLVFGFEYAILLIMIVNITIKYLLHAADARWDAPWENKAAILLYTDLAINFVKVLLYLGFVVIMVRISTLPLFAFRPMYETLRSFKKAYNDVVLSRRAIRNMNTLYPDATAEELAAADNECIICREEMHGGAKKLPCNHIFHAACLRLWFQRQQTCPTCRLNVLRTPPDQPPTRPANTPPAFPNVPPPGFPNIPPPAGFPNIPPAQGFPNIPPPPGFPNIPMPPGFPNIPLPPGFPNLPSPPGFMNVPPPPGFANAAPSGQGFQPPMFLGQAMPPRPPSLAPLSTEELQRLEGTERAHIEARLQVLREIGTMLDASVTLMQQYSAVVSRLPTYVPAPAPQPQTTVPKSEGVKVKTEVKAEASTASTSRESAPAPGAGASGTAAPRPSTTTPSSSRGADEADAEELRRRRLQKLNIET